MHEQLFDAEVNKMVEVRAPPPHYREDTLIKEKHVIPSNNSPLGSGKVPAHSGAGLSVHFLHATACKLLIYATADRPLVIPNAGSRSAVSR